MFGLYFNEKIFFSCCFILLILFSIFKIDIFGVRVLGFLGFSGVSRIIGTDLVSSRFEEGIMYPLLKVRLYVKLFDFFRGGILIRLKFVAFSPKFNGDSYVEFQEKTISGEFFINFVQTKAIFYFGQKILLHVCHCVYSVLD